MAAIEKARTRGYLPRPLLLASWLIMTGCLRHQHLERSHPVPLTASTFHFYCEKGKQAHKRGGFRFAIPAAFQWVAVVGRLEGRVRAAASLQAAVRLGL